MSRQVLVCGDERLLLRTRDMVLTRAGLSVVSACTRAEIAYISKVPAVELGIIGHSLTAAEQREVAEDVRERWPGVKILFLKNTASSLERISADEYQSRSDNPVELIATCQQILGSAPDEN
jgi:DNA-binding NarL/FixJ family response regulator